MVKQLKIPVEGNDTIEDYVELALESFIADNAEPVELQRLILLNRFSDSASAKVKYEVFNELFGTENSEELAPIYGKYLDQIADYLEEDNLLMFPVSLSEDSPFDYKNYEDYWSWDEQDPLVLQGNNKGLVVRYVILKVLYQLNQELLHSYPPL